MQTAPFAPSSRIALLDPPQTGLSADMPRSCFVGRLKQRQASLKTHDPRNEVLSGFRDRGNCSIVSDLSKRVIHFELFWMRVNNDDEHSRSLPAIVCSVLSCIKFDKQSGQLPTLTLPYGTWRAQNFTNDVSVLDRKVIRSLTMTSDIRFQKHSLWSSARRQFKMGKTGLSEERDNH